MEKKFTFCNKSKLLSHPPTSCQIFVQAVIGPLAGTATPLDKLDVKVTPAANGTATCFSSAPSEPVPSTYLCCDPLSDFPDKCFEEYPETPHVGINRTLVPSCHASPPAMAPTAPPSTSPKAAASSSVTHVLLFLVVVALSYVSMSC